MQARRHCDRTSCRLDVQHQDSPLCVPPRFGTLVLSSPVENELDRSTAVSGRSSMTVYRKSAEAREHRVFHYRTSPCAVTVQDIDGPVVASRNSRVIRQDAVSLRSPVPLHARRVAVRFDARVRGSHQVGLLDNFELGSNTVAHR
jgi:hypothetical protein